ncbi:hypothetical protein G1H10_24500 [Phytoactinopolyspora halotolerans]|uniref:DUF7937 domain-containing protein n=1 Tax=Phytoactinopolyspora halotolerans TaxID=1981512 RepID=A0A6L9SFW9_9ACTN|nr:hypothetical protein [Phytoactinopolyspora halotolerans]NEE03332.1 hypothetical protein [Phytoactinopolyspora halotolerans]
MIPAGDYMRDALAVVLLLLPLGMAWDMDHQAVGLSQLIVATLLSILSLALRYLKSASVLPDAMTPGRVQAVRLLMNTPYAIAVVVTLVLGYVGDARGGGPGSGGGVGVGMAIGLAGVLLAAQGRAAEQRGEHSDAALWRGITMVIAVVALALGTLSAVITMVEMSDDAAWNEFVVLLLGVVLFTVVPLIAVRGVTRGDSVWRDVVVVLGVAGLLAAVWAQAADDTMGEAWSLRLDGPDVLFWPGLGAAAAAAGISAAAPAPHGAVR